MKFFLLVHHNPRWATTANRCLVHRHRMGATPATTARSRATRVCQRRSSP